MVFKMFIADTGMVIVKSFFGHAVLAIFKLVLWQTLQVIVEGI